MPAPIMSKDEVVDLLLETFRRDGYDGGSLAHLSQSTGLGKSSLYHYFPGGKAEMAHAVLERLATTLGSDVGRLAADTRPPAKRLAAILDIIDTFYDSGAKACLLERLCASVDRDLFQVPLGAAFESLIGAIEKVLRDSGMPKADAGVKAEEAIIRIQGALVVSAGLRDNGPFKRTLWSLRKTLA